MKKQNKKESKPWDKTQKPKAPKSDPGWYKETVLFKTSKTSVPLDDLLNNIPTYVETSEITIKYSNSGWMSYTSQLKLIKKEILKPDEVKEHSKKLKVYQEQLKQHNAWLIQQKIKKLEEKLNKK